MTDIKLKDVLFEFTRVGTSVRVVAVDASTGTEVVFQGPTHASKAELRRIALSKLNYVLQKQKDDDV